MAESKSTDQLTSVTPPGATLADLLEEKGMSQGELAWRMSLPEETIRGIIQGKAALTPEAAHQLESVFDVPAQFWIAREANDRAFLGRSGRA